MSEIPPYLKSEIGSRVRAGMPKTFAAVARRGQVKLDPDEVENLAIAFYLIGYGAGAAEVLDRKPGGTPELMSFLLERPREA